MFSLSFKLTGPECKISNFFPYTLNVHSSEFGRYVPRAEVIYTLLCNLRPAGQFVISVSFQWVVNFEAGIFFKNLSNKIHEHNRAFW